MVTELGFRSDPNMHRAHNGPPRVRIQAGQEVVGAKQDFWKAGVKRVSIFIYLPIGRRQSKCCDGAKKKVLRMAATSALTFTTFSYKAPIEML
jgi:hypothetical protein